MSVAPATPDSGPDSKPMVRFEGVQKTYDGENLVVRNLDLEVRRGEFLTLLGPSGSGKTTTLMMLAGFEAVTAGTIELNGKIVHDLPPFKRGLGMVFQNYALFPHMTVAGNVAFPLEVRGMASDLIAGRVAEALAMVRLTGYQDRRPAQLSGGQQQRVALARALVFGPQLVLLDEPLGALDRQLREGMQYELKQLHQRLGVTMIYVTHDQGEALTMSDRVAVFNDGMIQQVSSPMTIYEEPANQFVARFVGESNRMTGVVVSRQSEHCVVRLANGVEIRALAIGNVTTGSPAMLSLRPERVRVGPHSEGRDNRFSAMLIDVTFLGDQLRGRLDFAGLNDFIFKYSNAESRPPLDAGTSVAIGWDAADCRAFAE